MKKFSSIKVNNEEVLAVFFYSLRFLNIFFGLEVDYPYKINKSLDYARSIILFVANINV